jgi:superfamily II DNA or RNA helicase
VTDGSLLTELIKNIFLKEEIITYNNNKYNTQYTETNKYDIIIVDEAHEHNTNMDLILTLCRNSCFINNDLKLIIMSATMDDDESNFRRYYNIINDNLVYPIKSLDDYELRYDSIYLDRRFHIAPYFIHQSN